MELILSTGSNLGDRLANLRSAEISLSKILGDPIARSGIYETEAWGFEGYPFYNQVLIFESKENPENVFKHIQEIELGMGRTRVEGRYVDRSVDIDILFQGDSIVKSTDMTIPHPRLHQRMFVLEPLAELRPGLIHPVLGKTVTDLLLETDDQTEIKRLECDTISLP